MPTSIFAKIPLTESYYSSDKELIVFQDTGSEIFPLTIQGTHLDSINFELTDDKGRNIVETFEGQDTIGNLSCKMTLKFQTLADTSSEMLELMKANLAVNTPTSVQNDPARVPLPK